MVLIGLLGGAMLGGATVYISAKLAWVILGFACAPVGIGALLSSWALVGEWKEQRKRDKKHNFCRKSKKKAT